MSRLNLLPKRSSLPFLHSISNVASWSELDVLQRQLAALKKLQAETATELDALLPSVLDKAFKGQL